MDEDVNRRIGKNIKALRDERGMSQAELAERMTAEGVPGMHPQTITKIEAGTRALKYTEGLAISRVLDINMKMIAQVSRHALTEWRLTNAISDFTKMWDAQADTLAGLLDYLEGLEKLIEFGRRQGVTESLLAWIEEVVADTSVEQLVATAKSRQRHVGIPYSKYWQDIPLYVGEPLPTSTDQGAEVQGDGVDR